MSEHDDDLHERWHNPKHPRRIGMGELMERCPACAEEAAEEDAAELAIIAEEAQA